MSDNVDTSGPLSRERERVRVRARSLRETSTDAEALLWFHLRDRRLANHKFRRQRPIGSYFADFACVEARLVVELDGGQHAQAAAYDEDRTRFMQSQGYRVLRFWNDEVLTRTKAVRERILQALQEDNPHPHPLPQAGEGARQKAAAPSGGRARQDTRNLKP
jgi:adenine-specific DNA-methyltransferase